MKHQTIQLPAEHDVMQRINELQQVMEAEASVPGSKIPKWAVVLHAVNEALKYSNTHVDNSSATR